MHVRVLPRVVPSYWTGSQIALEETQLPAPTQDPARARLGDLFTAHSANLLKIEGLRQAR